MFGGGDAESRRSLDTEIKMNIIGFLSLSGLLGSRCVTCWRWDSHWPADSLALWFVHVYCALYTAPSSQVTVIMPWSWYQLRGNWICIYEVLMINYETQKLYMQATDWPYDKILDSSKRARVLRQYDQNNVCQVKHPFRVDLQSRTGRAKWCTCKSAEKIYSYSKCNSNITKNKYLQVSGWITKFSLKIKNSTDMEWYLKTSLRFSDIVFQAMNHMLPKFSNHIKQW
jgi:hypothetical protein